VLPLIKDYLIEKIIQNQIFGVILQRNQKGNLIARDKQKGSLKIRKISFAQAYS
jgi:hypothetical protein